MSKMLIGKTDILGRVYELEEVEMPDGVDFPVLLIGGSAPNRSIAGSVACERLFGTSKQRATRSRTWQELARFAAYDYLTAQALKDLFPSQIQVAEYVANYLRTNKIFGADARPLSAATIKRHALKGIHNGLQQARR